METPWYKRWWVVLVVIVFIVYGVLSIVGIIVDQRSVKETDLYEDVSAEAKELNKYVVHCGEYWYFRDEMHYYKCIDGQLEFLRSVLKEADKLNGIEWRGYASYYFHDTIQIGTLSDNGSIEWSEWKSQNPQTVHVDALLEKKNGKWTIDVFYDKHRGMWEYTTGIGEIREITCADIAGS